MEDQIGECMVERVTKNSTNVAIVDCKVQLTTNKSQLACSLSVFYR